MKKSKIILRNILLAAGSIVITLVFLELGIRIFFPQPTQYFYFKSKWKPGECYTRWGDIKVCINNHGQRDYDRTLEKPPGVYRIVLLGDSIAFGCGVSLENSYSKQLETLLNKKSSGKYRFEVISFTNGGDEPSGYLEMLKENALGFSPDLVMAGFTLNDFERPPEKRTKNLKEKYYDILRFVHMHARVWSHLYFLIFERSRAVFYKYKIIDKSVRRSHELDILETRGKEFRKAWKFTKKNLDMIRELSYKKGAGFALAVFPYEMQLSPKLLNLYHDNFGFDLSDEVLHAKPQQLLKSFSEKRGFVLIDMFEPFRKAVATEELYFRELGGNLDFVHPNKRGHEIAANVIFDTLRCGEILPENVNNSFSRDDCAQTDISHLPDIKTIIRTDKGLITDE